MRIALIGCTVNPRVGGMGRALYDHAMALAEAGQEVVVYTLDSIGPRGAGLQNDRGVAPLQNDRGAVSVHDDRITVGKLRRFFSIGKAAWGARFDPPLDTYDVVHLHFPFFGVSEAVTERRRSVILEERAQRATIGSINQLDSIGPATPGLQNDKKWLFVTYHMDAVGTGLKRKYFNWWYRHRFKKVLAACDAIAVTSRAYARDSQLARAGVDVEKCEEILLMVDTKRFNVAVTPARAEPYLLFVGALDRAHYFKGVSLLLHAFGSLDSGSGAGMTISPRLVVVGSGELLNEYKKEAADLGIADRVTFTGGVSDEELARWYAGARALVLPSTDRSEAFGIVLIEAMACGTPVITSDLPGVREVVERVSGGVLVPLGIASSSRGGTPRNDSLNSALQKMWDAPWNADDRAALAARTAAIYGRATLADQLLKWYNQTHVPS